MLRRGSKYSPSDRYTEMGIQNRSSKSRGSIKAKSTSEVDCEKENEKRKTGDAAAPP